MRLIIVFSFFLISLAAQAQQTREELLQQVEQVKRTRLMQQIDSGVYYMDTGEHMRADATFKYVMHNIASIPSDLAFYFGKNSYFLGLYKQSIDWLSKYIQLKGTNGQFSEEAVNWLKKAEADFVKEKNKEVKNVEQVLSASYDIDCGPSGKVYCPVCKGTHVVIKKGTFSDSYSTCSYCNEHGLLTCEEYNQLLRGELKPKF